MEIEHIGDNKIRCALTEQEIESLGYDIDEIIANSEITQEFMHTVLELVEEQEHIQMEGISPMVKRSFCRITAWRSPSAQTKRSRCRIW